MQVATGTIQQGGHKPGILGDFSEHGKLREFCATSVKTDLALWVQPASSNPYAAESVSGARKLLISVTWDDRLLLLT